MKLFRSLSDSPIESLAALVLVGGGVYVSAIGSAAESHKTGLLAAGGILTTFGGVLFAWVVAKAFAEEKTRSEFNDQLGHLSRNLGQAAGQISRAVEQSQLEDMSSETGLALISQANRMIYGQVSEIAVIRGAGFDPAYLLETATTLDGLARQLESDGSPGPGLERVRERLQEVRKGLSAPTRTYSETSVRCPSCDKDVVAHLGSFPGDTANVVCDNCGTPFNAHRTSDGTAISRAIKGQHGSDGERWSFSCPDCGHQASALAGTGTKQMICLECYEALEVDLERKSVKSRGAKFRHEAAPIVGRKGSRPLVECPDCHRQINVFLPRGGNFLGMCHQDLRLFEVSRSEFESWKQEHDGPASPPSGTEMPSPIGVHD